MCIFERWAIASHTTKERSVAQLEFCYTKEYKE